MYCIVNSIDPLDLKEDDNESNCSADSWELLDYEDNNQKSIPTKENDEAKLKPEKTNNDEVENIPIAAIGAGPSSVCSKQPTTVGGGSKKSNKKNKGARKQRVTFEIPDLVNEETTTIELKNSTTKLEEENAVPLEQKNSSLKAGGRNSQQQQHQKQNANKPLESTTSQIKSKSTIITSSNKQEDKQVCTIVKTNVVKKPIDKKAQAQPCARAPILNYAAALTAKLDNNNSNINNNKNNNKPETLPNNKSTDTKDVQVAGVIDANSTQTKVVKRNRPVSSSSWSSCDDDIIEDIDQILEASEFVEKEQDKPEIDLLELPTNNNNNDDGESIVSNGFSDSDYGFGGLHDYVMRPKKAQTKRRRHTSSTSSSLLSSMAKRGNERVAESSSKKNDRTTEVSDPKSSVVKQSSTSSRNIKPKKKKMTLSTPNATQSDFLKRASENVAQSSQKSPPLDSKTIDSPKNMDIKAKLDSKRQLMPPPTIVPQGAIHGSDSSEIPDMDESWYLTPPPCFTGAAANKLCIIPKPKAKEAARENLLIEHPSIYIASTSKQATTTTPSVEEVIVQIENQEPERVRRNKSSLEKPKVLVKVEPIEPERQPGWQLKKKRSKRRPLVSLTSASSSNSTKQSITTTKTKKQEQQLDCPSYVDPLYSELYECVVEEGSTRPRLTFIDRIGSSIVANLTNLTNGFASSTGMNMQARAPLGEAAEKNQIGLISKSESGELSLKARKRMSKGYLNRQNNCKKVGSNRRTDRRAKMHSTQNGVSVNRKVHTNFH